MTTNNIQPTYNRSADTFSNRLLSWFSDHGRHELPWQQHKTDIPNTYYVWLSEVMLQQTQVSTVIPYFKRFIESFPSVQHLATADWDSVADHWAGLGYYARARNLHKGAKQLVNIIDQTGQYPQSVEEWEAISGVGRSTAGAVVSMGLHRYGVICDGNVKRVLTRWAGIDGDISKTSTNKQLWALAEELTPQDNSGQFAQAMMDMGATVCVRTKPACLATSQLCPLQSDCIAYAQKKPLSYPVKTKKPPKPSKLSQALIITNPKNQTLWIQRPDTGIWGGLWCLPLQFINKVSGQNAKKILTTNQLNPIHDESTYEKEYNTAEQIINNFLTQHIKVIEANYALTDSSANDTIKHTLTHFHWYLVKHYMNLNHSRCQQLSNLLTNANIAHQWLSTETAVNQLAMPKAMLRLVDE